MSLVTTTAMTGTSPAARPVIRVEKHGNEFRVGEEIYFSLHEVFEAYPDHKVSFSVPKTRKFFYE